MPDTKLKLAGRPRSPKVESGILSSAIKLVAKTGYANTSIEKIAVAAGVGKTTIYRRWDSKAALMVSAYQKQVPQQALVNNSGDFKKELRQLLNTVFEIYRKTFADKILGGLIAEAQNDANTLLVLKQGVVQQRRKILTALILRAIDRGELSTSLDVNEVNDLIVAMIWHRLLTDREHLDSTFTETIIRQIIAVGQIK